MTNNTVLDFEVFKEVFILQLERELIVDNPILGSKRAGEFIDEKGNYFKGGDTLKGKDAKPVVKMDYIFEALKASSRTNQSSSNSEKTYDEFSDRVISHTGGKEPLPLSLCDLLIYAIHKAHSQIDLREKLRAFIFDELKPMSGRLNSFFDIPSVPQSEDATDGNFKWAQKLSYKLFQNIEKKKLINEPDFEINKNHYLESIIARFEDPKGFTLSPHDIKRYRLLK